MNYFIHLIFNFLGVATSFFVDEIYVIQYEYSQSIEMDENRRRSYPPEILEQITEASSRTYHFKLSTNENESVMAFQPKISNSQTHTSVEIEPDLKWVYKDLNHNSLIDLIEWDKKYYVQDSIENINWIENQETKEILNHKVKKFSYENENQIMEIWQVENIKIPNGPLNFGGNKNLILEASIKSKQGGLSWKYTATEISTLKDYNFISEMPKNIISKKDFDEIKSKFQKKSSEMIEEMDKD